MEKKYILDASSFLSVNQLLTSYNSVHESQLFFTTPEIQLELKDNFSRLRLESMLASQNLVIQSCSSEMLKIVKNECLNIGNLHRISSADQSILGLALDIQKQFTEFVVILLTDDYEIQNTASFLSINYKSIVQKGIKRKKKYKKKCQVCKALIKDFQLKKCSECGSFIRR